MMHDCRINVEFCDLLIKKLAASYSLWPGWYNQCNDFLRAGQHQVQTLVWARFSEHNQTGTGAHPSFCTLGNGSPSRGYSGQGVVLTVTNFWRWSWVWVEMYLYISWVPTYVHTYIHTHTCMLSYTHTHKSLCLLFTLSNTLQGPKTTQ